ncbi:quinon protein alcohol dehydrogenase-like superfamily, partial [Dimargaris cristalligena]
FLFEVGIPINCVAAVGSDPTLFVVGGGGGPSRSGVANKILINRIDSSTQSVTTVATYSFEPLEDAPTSIAAHPSRPVIACGANNNNDIVKAGDNRSARILEYSLNQDPPQLELIHSRSVMDSRTMNDYQKVTVFSPKGDHILTGGSEGSINLLAYPSLDPVFPTLKSESGEIMSADFSQSGGQFAIVTPKDVSVFSTRTGKGVQHIECPVYKNKSECRFRSCLYGRGPTEHFFYTIVNTLNRDRSLIAKWNTNTWETESFRSVSRFPIIAVAMHPSGNYLAVATTENAVYVLDAHSFQTMAKSADVHGFAITSLAFTSDGAHLVTGSIDTNCCIIPIP